MRRSCCIITEGGTSVQIDYSNETEKIKEEEKGIVSLVSQNFEVSSQQECDNILDLIKKAKKIKKDREERRKNITRKLDDAKKEIMDFFRPLQDKLSLFISINEKLVLDWRKKENERVKKEEEALRLKQEQEKKEQPEDELDDLLDGMQDVQQQTKIMASAPKVKGVTKYYSCEVVDVEKLPREYMIPDEKRLNSLARAEKENFKIPGCKLITDEKIK